MYAHLWVVVGIRQANLSSIEHCLGNHAWRLQVRALEQSIKGIAPLYGSPNIWLLPSPAALP